MDEERDGETARVFVGKRVDEKMTNRYSSNRASNAVTVLASLPSGNYQLTFIPRSRDSILIFDVDMDGIRFLLSLQFFLVVFFPNLSIICVLEDCYSGTQILEGLNPEDVSNFLSPKGLGRC